jgi:uncharacterized protein
MDTESKFRQLESLLRSYGSVMVAYSGGVDSVFLAKVAHALLDTKSLAVIADSESLPRRELDEALTLGNQFGFSVRVIKTNELGDSRYASNPANRCYFCKHELFEQLVPLARAEGFAVVVYGENASDVGDFRPGAQAAAEFQIKAPLKEVGLTKPEIRQLSARLGLPTADKPQMACLSSRIPYGEEVTEEKLRMIEAAEAFLRDAGFHDVRVRHHALANKHFLARIEVGFGELQRFVDNGLIERVAARLREIGYAHVTLDLQGYRRGSTNEVLVKPRAARA